MPTLISRTTRSIDDIACPAIRILSFGDLTSYLCCSRLAANAQCRNCIRACGLRDTRDSVRCIRQGTGMALSGLFNGNRFSFGFDADQDRSEKEHPKPCTIAADAGDSGCLAVVINDIDAGSVQFCARQVVRVDWSSSSWRQIAVVDKPGQAPVFVDAKCLSLMDTASRRVDDDLWLLDIVFGFDTKTIPTGKLHFSTNPLTIEPSLQSIVWPLHVNAFMRDVYNRRALVVHAGVHRTRFLRDSLSDFNVDSLLDSASRIVVWMRSAVDGRMQYLDVGSPDVARACYRAGHSLYFNPEYDFQKRFIRGICQDLGMDFTRAIQDGGIGGDVEVFAVAGRHHTPWHWDAQHNFTGSGHTASSADNVI